MYKCDNCDYTFDEPSTVNTTYSQYLGIESYLGCHPLDLYLCPRCGSEEISEVEEDEEE